MYAASYIWANLRMVKCLQAPKSIPQFLQTSKYFSSTLSVKMFYLALRLLFVSVLVLDWNLLKSRTLRRGTKQDQVTEGKGVSGGGKIWGPPVLSSQPTHAHTLWMKRMVLTCTPPPHLTPTETAHITAKLFSSHRRNSLFVLFTSSTGWCFVCSPWFSSSAESLLWGQRGNRNLNPLKSSLGSPPNFGTKPTCFPGNN